VGKEFRTAGSNRGSYNHRRDNVEESDKGARVRLKTYKERAGELFVVQNLLSTIWNSVTITFKYRKLWSRVWSLSRSFPFLASWVQRSLMHRYYVQLAYFCCRLQSNVSLDYQKEGEKKTKNSRRGCVHSKLASVSCNQTFMTGFQELRQNKITGNTRRLTHIWISDLDIWLFDRCHGFLELIHPIKLSFCFVDSTFNPRNQVIEEKEGNNGN
jgi:hypothetical protein